jgi:hypothetical protein
MVPDLQPGSTTTRTEGDVVRMCDQVQVTTMRFSRPGDIIGAEGGAAPTSPPEGVLRHMRHQEFWRAVGTHYGPTRIYGPTGHAIGGTAQQALRELLPRLSQPGLGTISDDYGPAAFRRSKDLAAAAGARATRMSRLRAGDAAGGRGLGASPCDRTYDDHATAGAGQGVSPRARDSECSASQLDAACARLLV